MANQRATKEKAAGTAKKAGAKGKAGTAKAAPRKTGKGAGQRNLRQPEGRRKLLLPLQGIMRKRMKSQNL